MNLSYVRVSTVDQNDATQRKELENFQIEKWFVEKISAKNAKRPKLLELLDFCREGDTIYIYDFSRLARNVKDLLNLVDIFDDKGVVLVSVKESLDTSTPSGRLMLTVLGAIYEFERAILLEKQREGIAIAKAEGRYSGGRKAVDFPLNWDEVFSLWKAREISSKVAMERLELKKTTFYKLVAKAREDDLTDDV